MNDQVTLLEATNIKSGYKTREVIRDISFKVRSGTLLGVIGPNGSGKSTLIKTLTGLVPLTGGTILLKGRHLSLYKALERAENMSVVPQIEQPAFAFSVREVVEMGRHPHHLPKDILGNHQTSVQNALEATDTAHLAKRRIDELSSGELQRVMIARALAQETPVMLLDEPTAHLDLAHQQSIFELLVRLSHTQGKAIICVSHDLNLAAEYCDALMLVSIGKIFTMGAPREVLTAQNLQSVYGTLVYVRDNPVSGQPLVLPNKPKPAESGDES
ncbi:MAG: heme ABC transporter ATP-binding protein [Verrucomicrobiota bacterium]|nr:heme ABC transporter ATP-binding protein [Verrucomicrobiota bacterium]